MSCNEDESDITMFLCNVRNPNSAALRLSTCLNSLESCSASAQCGKNRVFIFDQQPLKCLCYCRNFQWSVRFIWASQAVLLPGFP